MSAIATDNEMVEPFTPDVPESQLDDLRRRLDEVRREFVARGLVIRRRLEVGHCSV